MTQDTIIQIAVTSDNYVMGLSSSGKLYRLEFSQDTTAEPPKQVGKWVLVLSSPTKENGTVKIVAGKKK